jgi:hypothetical protein
VLELLLVGSGLAGGGSPKASKTEEKQQKLHV